MKKLNGTLIFCKIVHCFVIMFSGMVIQRLRLILSNLKKMWMTCEKNVRVAQESGKKLSQGKICTTIKVDEIGMPEDKTIDDYWYSSKKKKNKFSKNISEDSNNFDPEPDDYWS